MMTDEDRAPPTFGSIEQQNSSIFCLNSSLLWDEVEVPTILSSGTSGQNKALPPPSSVCTESAYYYYPRSKNDFARKLGGWVGFLRYLTYVCGWKRISGKRWILKKTIEDLEIKNVHLRRDPEWIIKEDSTIRTIDKETNGKRAKFETIGRDEAKENLNALQGEGDTQDLGLDKSVTAKRPSSGNEDQVVRSISHTGQAPTAMTNSMSKRSSDQISTAASEERMSQSATPKRRKTDKKPELVENPFTKSASDKPTAANREPKDRLSKAISAQWSQASA